MAILEIMITMIKTQLMIKTPETRMVKIKLIKHRIRPMEQIARRSIGTVK